MVEVSFWNDRGVLVTGASGLLGSFLVEELLRRGARPICLVRDWVPESRLLAEVVTSGTTLVRGELESYEQVLRAINEHETDSIFHLGAQTIVGTALRSALSTFDANVRGTWNVLEAAKACGSLVQRIVVASSDKAYGAHESLPYTEDTPLVGRFPYDVSKSCADLIAFSYAQTYGMPVTITRCGNLFGAGDLNFSRLIPGTIRSVLRGERPIIRSDGRYIRDYFYVRDAVAAYLTVAERLPAEGVTGEAFNFGTETPMTVIEVVNRILVAMDAQGLQPEILSEASREIREQYLDCTRARQRLDWKPNWAFDDGLAETIEWYREHFERGDC